MASLPEFKSCLKHLSMRSVKELLKIFFFLIGIFTPCKAEQPLRGIELQGKEVKKG